MRLAVPLLLLAVPFAACVSDDKGDEEALPLDGKDDSFRQPTDHGPIGYAAPVTDQLTAEQRYHAWTFELTGDARVDLATAYAVRGQRRTDTVLYLYRATAAGWGAYIGRNDDAGDSVYSRITKDLPAGRYRVLVKGYATTTVGKFKLTAGCDGDGCAAPVAGCVFGGTYGDITGNPALAINNANKIYPTTLGTLSAGDQQRLMVAVQQSSHTDVTTPAEAIQRVDQQEVNVTWISEPAAHRSYIAFEYGAGDNSYGAIFDRVSGAMVTNIHDGDLESCATPAEICQLPADYGALKTDPAFAHVTDRQITAAAQLTTAEADQVLFALRRVYGGDLVSVDAGLALADDHRVNYRTYLGPASTALTVVELGAGDTSVGAIFYGPSLELAGVIEDLFIDGCTLFAPR